VVWRGPEHEGELPSLGWDLLDWWAEHLPSPRDPDKPLIFTDAQAKNLIRWYTIHPVTGRFVYRRGCSRGAKGKGKSPVEAAKCIAELAGPVRFDGWDADGEPVGRPWGMKNDPSAWVQIAAVSEDQTENTHSVVYEFLTANDGKAAEALMVDPGLTRTYLRDGKRHGKLEPVTAAAGSREGQPITYAAKDETHLWTPRNGGVRLSRTLNRNAGKMDGRTYETTNSFEPGMGTVAEATHKAHEQGAVGIYMDAVEAPRFDVESASDDEIADALRVAFEDSWWVDIPRLVADIRDPDMPREDAERFFFNWNVAATGKAVDPKVWAGLARADGKPAPGSYIGLGFDGSISQDATVLRGCTRDGYSFIVGSWVRPYGVKGEGWRVPRLEVDQAVRDAFATWTVGRMNCDPPKWQSEIEAWAREFGDERVLFFDTNSSRRMGMAVDTWLTGIANGSHTHDGDPVTTEHVLNAHKLKTKSTAPDDDSRTLFVLTKPEGGGKIDAAIADVLALEAAVKMPAQPPVYGPMVAFT
jgi:hypothetical protein